MTKIKAIIATFAISTLMAIAAIAQDLPQASTPPAQPDAKEILKKVSHNLLKAESFQLEGQTTFEMKSEGIQVKVDLPFAIAQTRDGKYKAEVRIPILGKVLMSCDGKNEWMYFDFDKEYSKKPFVKKEEATDPQTLAYVAGAFQMLGLPFADVAGADTSSDAKNARILREEKININGGEVACYVIEVEYDLSKNPLMGLADTLMESKPGEAQEANPQSEKLEKLRKAMKEGTGKVMMWVDKERFLIVRHDSTGGLLGQLLGVFGESGAANISTELKVAKMNETIPEAFFTFTPPADAKEKIEKAPAEEPASTSLVGSPAAEFTLKDLNGKPVKSSSLRGKVVVLDFWASWCGPCRETMPEVEKLHRDFKDKGLAVFGVNDEEAAEAREFVQKNGYTFPTLLDEGSALSDQYGVTAIPQALIIDRDGKVFAHFFGTGKSDDLREAVKVALATKAENNPKPARKAPPRPGRVAAKGRR
jgi:peroxiredoxin/outer membrane lipoprotein-sorting protein